MAGHTRALVPLESWAYNSPKLRASGRGVDIGLMAEALIYYEAILINVSNQPLFAELLRWFVERGLYDEFLGLVRDSTITFYDYSFATAAVLIEGSYSIWNIQDQIQAQPDTFERRFLYHREIEGVLTKTRQRYKLYDSFRRHVVEAKADDFAAAIENARADFNNPRRNAIVVQAFVNELYLFRKLGRPPEVAAEVRSKPDGTGNLITWNVSFEKLAELGGSEINFGAGTPLTAGAHCNRHLLSASREHCDLYLGSPMSSVVGDKLYETVRTPVQLGATVDQLKAEVEFPDIRQLVNDGDLSFREILTIRKKAQRFRNWLQAGADRDRNAIIAYHHEVAQEAGLIKAGRTTLRLFGIVAGGALGGAIGAAAAGPIGGAVGGAVGGGSTYLLDLAAKIREEWRPVVFGNWMEGRIKRFMDEENS